jgi:hypothetical protein
MKIKLKNSAILDLYGALVSLEPEFRPPLTLTKEARGAIAHNIYSLEFTVKKLSKIRGGFIREVTGGKPAIEKGETAFFDAFAEKWDPLADEESEVDIEFCSATELTSCMIPVVTIARMYPMFTQTLEPASGTSA